MSGELDFYCIGGVSHGKRAMVPGSTLDVVLVPPVNPPRIEDMEKHVSEMATRGKILRYRKVEIWDKSGRYRVWLPEDVLDSPIRHLIAMALQARTE